MADRSPEFITQWLDGNLHRFSEPGQYLGTEPGSVRKPWSQGDVRWLLAASWPYEHAAGNQSAPAVYRAINDGRPGALCDRFYLPATSRDLNLLVKGGIPVFGIESRHQLRDFDVAATSISYAVLFMNFCKMLAMSDVPLRWRDREARGLENYPMVMVGGQAYCAPEFMAPVADCFFLGEVEDEPGNGGISDINDRIAQFKQDGIWQSDRAACYTQLALEFNYLYFPRFTEVNYRTEDRGLPHPSKQVSSYRSLLPGQRMPFRARKVHDMDQIKPLTEAPLLFSNPSMGAGDLEVARGCPEWCGFCRLCLAGETEFITKDGVRRIDSAVGETVEVWTSLGWRKADVHQFADDKLRTITFAPAFRGWSHFSKGYLWKRTSSNYTVQHRATELHRWPLADGGETHHLAVGDVVAAEFTRDDGPDYDQGWLHGYVFGDGCQENGHLGERSNCYAALLWGDKDRQHLYRFESQRCDFPRDHSRCERPVCVVSMTDDGRRTRARMNSKVRLKDYPDGQSATYVRGFIEGWAAADGESRSRRDDRLRITGQRPDAEEWLCSNAAYGGWLLTGAYTSKHTTTNYGERKNPLRVYNLRRAGAWKVVGIERECDC